MTAQGAGYHQVAVRPAPGWSVGNCVAAGLEGDVRRLALDLAPLPVNVVAR